MTYGNVLSVAITKSRIIPVFSKGLVQFLVKAVATMASHLELLLEVADALLEGAVDALLEGAVDVLLVEVHPAVGKGEMLLTMQGVCYVHDRPSWRFFGVTTIKARYLQPISNQDEGCPVVRMVKVVTDGWW